MLSKGTAMDNDGRQGRAESPSAESVDRMLAFAALLAALEDGDTSSEAVARRRLKDLGLEVRVKGGAR
jgi:hypothetical protein